MYFVYCEIILTLQNLNVKLKKYYSYIYMNNTKKHIKNIKNNKTCKRCKKINYIPSADKDIKAVIDVNAIRNNLKFLKKKSGTELMPVLKADAYGHGMIEMAKILRKLSIKYIGVATLGEAILLRKSGDKGRILAWLYDVDSPELIDAFKYNFDIAIFDEKTLSKFIRLIPNNKKIKVTVFVAFKGIVRTASSNSTAQEKELKLEKTKQDKMKREIILIEFFIFSK